MQKIILSALSVLNALAFVPTVDALESPFSRVHAITPQSRVVNVVGPHHSSVVSGRHEITEYILPVEDGAPGVIDIAPDGKVWFVVGGGGFAGLQYKPLSYVARIDSDSTLTLFELPTPGAIPNGIKIHADGRAFVTEYGGNKIAVIEADGTKISEFPVQAPSANPTALDFSRDGRLWFNLNKAHLLAYLTPEGKIVEMPIPTRECRPTGLVVDDKENVWFAEMYGNKIGKYTKSGYFTEYGLSEPNSKPTAMLFDAGSGIWFSERGASKIGNIKNGRLRELALPGSYAGPFFITKGPDEAIWFTELYTGKIGRYDIAHDSFSEYDFGFGDTWPGSLIFDRQGNLWVSLLKGNRVVKINNR